MDLVTSYYELYYNGYDGYKGELLDRQRQTAFPRVCVVTFCLFFTLLGCQFRRVQLHVRSCGDIFHAVLFLCLKHLSLNLLNPLDTFNSVHNYFLFFFFFYFQIKTVIQPCSVHRPRIITYIVHSRDR
jgi:hypothetical protein